MAEIKFYLFFFTSSVAKNKKRVTNMFILKVSITFFCLEGVTKFANN